MAKEKKDFYLSLEKGKTEIMVAEADGKAIRRESGRWGKSQTNVWKLNFLSLYF